MGEARGKRCAGRIGPLVAARRQAANDSLQAGLLRIVKTPFVVDWTGVLGFHRDRGYLLALRICHATKAAMLVPFRSRRFSNNFRGSTSSRPAFLTIPANDTTILEAV